MDAAGPTPSPSHSRTLFLGDDGDPLRFYIRPGPTKASLLPLIIHGGGVMCRIQEPGAILLTEAGDQQSLPRGYVTAQYVLDSVKQNRQLALEGYAAERVSRPAAAGSQQPRQGPAYPCGKLPYTKLEDVAILMYVRRYSVADGSEGSVRGNALWREMERVQLTAHSWQSMKDRYLRHLRGRDHLYQIDSRSIIPTAIFPSSARVARAQEAACQQASKPEAGKRNPGSSRHADLESREDAPAPVVQVPDVNSEEECFNIFPIAIREFEVEAETPELLMESSDEMETKEDPQEQQMETDQLPQVSPGEQHPKRKRTLAEFIMDNKQSELDSQTPVDELSSLPTASQDEVECAIRAINTLMQAHDLDLCTATQLLLKNNGELTAALHFMETGHRPDGYPIWTHQDDLDLENVDGKEQDRLIQKFGSENLAKRIAFQKS
ncbi:telomeric repeat-binding factor 2-interacting protein 1 [Heptranchias perlo]|uniref:telomeric repeat-binding factor 2-interacting protein 1 n=1 Tax=Heptranchias perlo TaxID=212740 RepID=UPI00355A6868